MLYRLRNAANYLHFDLKTRGILATAPMPSSDNAVCDVHTMLCKVDLRMYLVAIKSLLRFEPRLAVTVHSDGTLEVADRALLTEHVPGIRIVLPDDANKLANERLGLNSFLWRWRLVDASYRRLMDTELWSRTPRRIIMDSDILVLRRSPELAHWIAEGGPPLLLGRANPLPPPEPIDPEGPHERIQTVFMKTLDQLTTSEGYPRFLNGTTGGFYACSDELSLPAIEALLRRTLEVAIPMHEWGGEQCMVIYLLSNAGGTRLRPEYCFNFGPAERAALDAAQIVHFFGTHRFHAGLYPALAGDVIRALARGHDRAQRSS